MVKRLLIVVVLIVGVAIPLSGRCAEKAYFEGKTFTMICGASPGGGMDIYNRLIARHISKYIPGHPTVVPDNLVGAGTLVSAKHLYSRVKPDGLTTVMFVSDLLMSQILGRKGVDFDLRQFEWIGVPVRDTIVAVLGKSSGVSNMDQWMASKTPLRIGAISQSDMTAVCPKMLKAVLGLPILVVDGYKGTNEIRLAVDSGELAGGGWQWEAIRVMWGKGLASGDISVAVQIVSKPHPELPNVPLASRYIKTSEGNQLMKAAILDPASITRLYALTPGTPKELVQVLRKAFMDTMKDPDLLAEAKKSRVDINPVSGPEVEEIVKGMFTIPPNITVKLKEIIYGEK